MDRATASVEMPDHKSSRIAKIFKIVAAASMTTLSPILACTRARMYKGSLSSSTKAAAPAVKCRHLAISISDFAGIRPNQYAASLELSSPLSFC